MQEGFPIVISVDEPLKAKASGLPALAANLEAWINFQALKAGWYSDENLVLAFDISLRDAQTFETESAQLGTDNWTVQPQQYAFHHDSANQRTIAFICLSDEQLRAGGSAVQQQLQTALKAVCNQVAEQYSLIKA